jgi:hypothetical protein
MKGTSSGGGAQDDDTMKHARMVARRHRIPFSLSPDLGESG